MTDYLEQGLEENERVLLKRERRLAAALAGAAGLQAAGAGASAAGQKLSTASDGQDEQTATEMRTGALRPEAGMQPAAAGMEQEETGRAASPLLRPAADPDRSEEQALSPWRDALAAAEGRSVLLNQLERLERAAAPAELREEIARRPAPLGTPGMAGAARTGFSGAVFPYGGTLWPEPAGDGAGEPLPFSGVERGTALPGGDQNRAEQVDRAFRKDSRRYDGGFYLY